MDPLDGPIAGLVEGDTFIRTPKFRWGPREGKEGGMNTPGLLPIALATPRTNFLGPPAVRCELGLDREKKCWTSGDDRATVYCG